MSSKNQKKRIHFRGIRYPLCRGLSVRQMVRELVETQSSPDGLFQVLRRTVLARRNTRFHLVPGYSKAGPVRQAEDSRRCRPVRTVPRRLVMR